MTEYPPEPVLDSETLREIKRGMAQFNEGKYFECHETFEDVWQGIRGPARNFFQGLIQLSVGLYHLCNANLRGAASQLEKGLANIEPYSAAYIGLDVAALRGEVDRVLEKVRASGTIAGSVADLPKMRHAGPGSVSMPATGTPGNG
jgi:predicted metal-dependent hydrolase